MSAPLVSVYGQASLAITGVVPRLPSTPIQTELEEISVEVGGPGARAATTCAILGCRARLFTRAADDFVAPHIISSLEQQDVEVHCVGGPCGTLTPLVLQVVTRQRDDRLAFSTPGDLPPAAVGELDHDQVLDGAKGLVLDGSYLDSQRHLARSARARGVPVIVGGTLISGATESLLADTDIFIASERLGSELAPRGELRDALLALQKLGPQVVVLTLGERGAIGRMGNRVIEVGPAEVAVVDGSGASDVFVGAFACAVMNQLDFQRCMEFANVAAALSCRTRSRCEGIPNLAEVVSFIEA